MTCVFVQNAFWIYTRQETSITAFVETYTSYSDLNLVEGWNFVPITDDMIGGYLEDILGDCDLERLYLWKPGTQEWEKISLEYSFSRDQFGYGFLIKAKNYCRLAGPEITPPPMPE